MKFKLFASTHHSLDEIKRCALGDHALDIQSCTPPCEIEAANLPEALDILSDNFANHPVFSSKASRYFYRILPNSETVPILDKDYE